MQTDEGGSNSAVAYAGSVHRQIMAGFSLPFAALAVEAGPNLSSTRATTVTSSDEIWNAQVAFSGAVAASHDLVNAFSADQEKLATLDSCTWIDQYPKNSTASETSPGIPTTPFEAMNLGYEVLPFVSPGFFERNGQGSDQTLDLTGNSAVHEWFLSRNVRHGLNSSNPGTSALSNELSLSLFSSQHPTSVHGESSLGQRSEVSTRSNGHVRSEQASCSSDNLSLSFVSSKPLSPMVQSGSRFFQAMQEIFAGIACYALGSYPFPAGIDNAMNDDESTSPAMNKHSSLSGERGFIPQNQPTNENETMEAKNKNLLALLQVIDEQYNQFLDEVHTVVSAFHAVTQLDPNLHARFPLPTISSIYKNLRERISSQILETGAQLEARQDNSLEPSLIQKQWALQQLISKRDAQLWRPQRGLPERSVSVLRAWMFQNFLHPYPRDAEKQILALKSGLTRSQVSNWFINARVRLWKPMIEDMYAEMKRKREEAIFSSKVQDLQRIYI